MTVIQCPECGERLEGNLGEVPAALDEETVRTAIDCPACTERLELVAGTETIETYHGP